jgi:hypothetical protein
LALLVLHCPGAALADAPDYVGHPKLLLSAADLPALRTATHGNGTNAREFRDMRNRADVYVDQHPDTLLDFLEGLRTVPELGLVHQVLGPSLLNAQPPGVAPVPLDPGAKVREVLLHLARTRDVDTNDYASSLRLRTLAVGYDLAFAEATPAERQEIRAEIIAYLDLMQSRFEYQRYLERPFTSNRGAMVGAAIGLATIAIWDDVSASERTALQPALLFGRDLVTTCITTILGSDGSYREGVLYGAWMLRMVIPYFEAERRFSGNDLGADPRIEKIAAWLAYEVLPEGGGRTNNLNDSLWLTRPLAVHGTYLDWAQYRFASPLAKYLERHVTGVYGHDPGADGDKVATVLWNRDIAAADPGSLLPAGSLFADRGIYYYRNGWKTAASGSEILFTFQSGAFQGGHAQEDQNHFTLYAYGDRYVLDHGSQYTSVLPKESIAHNIVLIDQLGQHNAGSSIGTDGSMSDAFLTAFADYVCGDATSAYTTYSPLNAPDVPFPGTDWSWGYDGGNPVQRAKRHVVSLKGAGAPPYFLIADDIRKDDVAHQYDWQIHTDASNEVDVSTDPVRITGSQSELRLYFARPLRAQGLAWSVTPFDHGGQDPITTRVRARITAVEPAFFTALVPCVNGQAPQAHQVSTIGAATELRLTWQAAQDNALYNPTGTFVFGNVATDATLALVRTSALGVIGYVMVGGSTLQYAGEPLLYLWDEAHAALADNVLHLSRAVEFHAWGANIAQVLGPDGPLPFVRDGDRIWSPTVTSPPGEPGLDRPYVRLQPNVPNPFTARSRLTFSLGQAGIIQLRVFDLRGRLVRTLTERSFPAGEASVFWDGTDDAGRRQAAGTYLLQLDGHGVTKTRKLVLVR